MAAKGRGTVLPSPDGISDGVVRLRRWRDDDGPLLAEAARDPYIALLERLAPPFGEWELTIEGAGGIGLAQRHVPGVAEIGYWVVERRRGEGLATRAVALLAGWAFAEAGVERLQATVEPWNVASQRVLETCGFEREGLLRGYASYGGTRRDVLIYGLLP